jgi:hypothetical protein
MPEFVKTERIFPEGFIVEKSAVGAHAYRSARPNFWPDYAAPVALLLWSTLTPTFSRKRESGYQSGQKSASMALSNDHGHVCGKIAAPRPVSRRAPMTASR